MLTNRLKLKLMKRRRPRGATTPTASCLPARKMRFGILRLKAKNLLAVLRKICVLGRLVPGCRKEALPLILEEATDYIDALEMQVPGCRKETCQLFPGNGGEDKRSFESEFRVESSETQWLNLSVLASFYGSTSFANSEQASPEIAILQQQVRRSMRGLKSRSSQYRGVTFYRITGRWESHIWDCGKQVYLGGFDTALAAARCSLIACIQCI